MNGKSRPIPYRPEGHGTIFDEWAPHRGVPGWWYVTGYLNERIHPDHLYFFQLTIYQGYYFNRERYLLHLGLTDFQHRLHLFEECQSPASERVYGANGLVTFDGNSLRIGQDWIAVRARGKNVRFTLTLTPDKPAVWHGDGGIVGMGYPDREDQRAFYASLTSLSTAGDLAYTLADNQWSGLVTGKSWVDREWGRFGEVHWDWFSLRFFDGEEIMLYAFPRTGYQGGTYVDRDGHAQTFYDYAYTIENWGEFQGFRFGLGWTITLPFKDRTYRILPLLEDQYNPSKIVPYWEGLCAITNQAGARVGYCVVETTQGAHSQPRE